VEHDAPNGAAVRVEDLVVVGWIAGEMCWLEVEVFHGLRKISLGGLARAISGNKLAAGGSVTKSGNNVTFVIDRHKFAVTADDDVVSALKRFSVTSQLSSTGRKPGWVK
jgi:hypothetical protein